MNTSIWGTANLAFAFGMELAALGALAWWGTRTGEGTAMKIALAVGIPVVAAVLWGLFAAPEATYGIPALAVATKILVFGAASLALWQLDHRIMAVAFPIVVAANLAIIHFGDHHVLAR
ncbi:hypothetical protein ABIA39_002382 [Nocardia sp. GAS34]|uniref:YrdB family protein n=1 Tax=unclassified Nocardia TaxID=2637762 RepID=UPI003D1D2A06